MMKPIILAFYLAAVPTSVSATAASTQIFPGLRKRQQQQKLAAAQKHTEKSQVVDPAEQDTQAAPAAGVVPPPMDVGPDGYPVLPAVSNMLGEASGTLKMVNSQASNLEARVVQAQMVSESKMAKQKAAFEEKLKEQETTNVQVIKASDDVTAEIKTLKKNNAALRKHAHEIETSSKLMRTELKVLQAHLGVATDFVGKSLTTTDDSKNSLLQVLRGSPRHHRALVEMGSSSRRKHDDDDDDDSDGETKEESDDQDDSDDDEEEAESFLSLSSKVNRKGGVASFEAALSELDSAVPTVAVDGSDSVSSNPGNLLESLSKEVANLAQQEKESQNKLKSLFIRDFRAGAKRHKALLVKQQGLVAERTSLLSLQAKLKSAEAHLEATHAQLEAELRGLGQFIQKLAHFAMAPQKEVPHLQKVLPEAVTVKAVKVAA